MKFVSSLLLTAALPALAAAEGFTAYDLGSTPTEARCLDVGELTFADFDRTWGISEHHRGNWSVTAFDVTGEHYDAIITCAYGPNDSTRATLVVYSGPDGDNEFRRVIVERLKDNWNDNK